MVYHFFGLLFVLQFLVAFPFAAMAESGSDIEAKIATINNAIEAEKARVKELISNVESGAIGPEEADQVGEVIDRTIEDLQMKRSRLQDQMVKISADSGQFAAINAAPTQQSIESDNENGFGVWGVIKWIGGAVVLFWIIGALREHGSSSGSAGSSGGSVLNFGGLKDIVARYSGRWEAGDYIDPEGYRYEDWKVTCGIGSGAGACMFYFGYRPNNSYPEVDGIRCDGYCAFKMQYGESPVIKERGERGEAASCKYWVPRSFSEGGSLDDDIRKYVESLFNK